MRLFARFIIVISAAVGVLVGFPAVASAALVGVHSCPPYYEGAVVEANGNYVSVCQNIL